MSKLLRNPNNYIPIEQLTFQSAAAHRPVSLGRAGLHHSLPLVHCIRTLNTHNTPAFDNLEKKYAKKYAEYAKKFAE
jgi:hypothetical protein